MKTRFLPTALIAIVPTIAGADSLTATYNITVTSQGRETNSQFVYARSGRRVAFADSRKTYRDVWEDTGFPGLFRLERVVDVMQSVVEFVPGELRLRGYTPSWESLQSPFGLDIRGNCDTRLSYVTECIPGESLPSRVIMKKDGVEILWQMAAFQTDAPMAAAKVEVDPTFRRWDAADFGDLENDKDLALLLPFAGLSIHGNKIHSVRPPSRDREHDHTH
jgi:hypothetical protein